MGITVFLDGWVSSLSESTEVSLRQLTNMRDDGPDWWSAWTGHEIAPLCLPLYHTLASMSSAHFTTVNNCDAFVTRFIGMGVRNHTKCGEGLCAAPTAGVWAPTPSRPMLRCERLSLRRTITMS